MKTYIKNCSNYLNESESDYQEFFKKKLEEYEVDSPNDLSDTDKKKFFNEIKSEWKG